MENIRFTPLFYKCESKKWEPVYRPEKRRDPGKRWERVFEVITKNQEIK